MSSLIIFNMASATRLARARSESFIISEHRGRDLPEEPVAIFQPPTLLDPSAFRQRRPEPVNFCLIVALNHERYGMIKRVEWSGAERHERLPHQRELDHFHRTGRAARTVRLKRR